MDDNVTGRSGWIVGNEEMPPNGYNPVRGTPRSCPELWAWRMLTISIRKGWRSTNQVLTPL